MSGRGNRQSSVRTVNNEIAITMHIESHIDVYMSTYMSELIANKCEAFLTAMARNLYCVLTARMSIELSIR